MSRKLSEERSLYAILIRTYRGGRKTKRSKITKFVFAGSAIVVLLLLCDGVLGALVVGAAGTGTTSISGTGPEDCSAVVDGTIPDGLNIDDGDDVRIYYNVSWSDTRSLTPDRATHYFNMTVSYTKGTGDQWIDLTKYTWGAGAGGSESLNITVLGVEEGERIGVIWMASISCSTCNDFDEISGFIDLL